jgi:Type II secretion system (T2SS), protein G
MIKQLIFLVIIVFGIGMAVPRTRSRIMDSVKPFRDNLVARLVPRRLSVMADQMDIRLGRAEGFPARFSSWLRRDYSGVPEDPWGHEYYLEEERGRYTVGSVGPDAKQGTADDITETRKMPGGR